MNSYDFAVIGGGSAGYAAASTAARLGLKTVVIEGGKEVGGLCILRGCMPSKTLLATARRASEVREASEFGVQAQLTGIDPIAMQARKRSLIEDFASYRRGQLESGRFDFIRGHARFVNPYTLEIRAFDGSTSQIASRSFLVATGSRISPAPISGLADTGFLDSDALLESETIPASVVVLGGGAIALEAATFYAGLGSKVTLLQRSARVLKEADADVSEAVQAGLRKKGIQLLTDVHLVKTERLNNLKRVHFEHQTIAQHIDAQEIVYALGRTPNTEGLDLEKIGIRLNSERIHTQRTQQTSLPHIFAAGDVCGPLEVVHIAIQQGEIAARNAAKLLEEKGADLESIDYRLKLLAVFSEPGVAMVGLTEAEAAQQQIPIMTSSYPFADHGKSMVEGHVDGFVKLTVHAVTREILGGAVVGPQAAELIHEIVVAMSLRSTAGALAQVPHYHPTLSEIWTYPAEDLA
ncbi:MAG: NAD(P)/FAD-dependent oxidoreductase [Verrucomicrobiota bacterium]